MAQSFINGLGTYRPLPPWNQGAAALAAKAGFEAIARSELTLAQIDLLVTASHTPDLALPDLSAEAQARLGVPPAETLALHGDAFGALVAARAACVAGPRHAALVLACDLPLLPEAPGGARDDGPARLWVPTAAAAVLEDRPNAQGLSLRLDWIERVGAAARLAPTLARAAAPLAPLSVQESLLPDLLREAEGQLRAVLSRRRGPVPDLQVLVPGPWPHLAAPLCAGLGLPAPLLQLARFGATAPLAALADWAESEAPRPGTRLLLLHIDPARLAVGAAALTCVGDGGLVLHRGAAADTATGPAVAAFEGAFVAVAAGLAATPPLVRLARGGADEADAARLIAIAALLLPEGGDLSADLTLGAGEAGRLLLDEVGRRLAGNWARQLEEQLGVAPGELAPLARWAEGGLLLPEARTTLTTQLGGQDPDRVRQGAEAAGRRLIEALGRVPVLPGVG